MSTSQVYWGFHMMTSSNGNIFRVTGPLRGEFTGHRWITIPKASDAELWGFLWSAPKQTVECTTETPGIWDTIALIMTSLLWSCVFRTYRLAVAATDSRAELMAGATHRAICPDYKLNKNPSIQHP